MCFYFFPVNGFFVPLAFLLLLLLVVFSFIVKISQEPEKIIFQTCAASLLLFFVLNFHFYPSVLAFQGGKALAGKITQEGIPTDRIAYLNNFETANDFDFQLKQNIPSVDLSNIIYKTKPLYIISGDMGYQALKSQGVPFKKIGEVYNYRVSKLNIKFLNPATRNSVLGKLYLLKIIGP
jgi:hypothetical protein